MKDFRGRYATAKVYEWSNCGGKPVEGEPHAHITGLYLTITTTEQLNDYMEAL